MPALAPGGQLLPPWREGFRWDMAYQERLPKSDSPFVSTTYSKMIVTFVTGILKLKSVRS